MKSSTFKHGLMVGFIVCMIIFMITSFSDCSRSRNETCTKKEMRNVKKQKNSISISIKTKEEAESPYHSNVKPETHYIEEDFKLVYANLIKKYDEKETIKRWLIQRLKDTTEFAELTTKNGEDSESCACGGDFIITDELFLKRKEGDILHFNYINKDHFFRIIK